MLLKLAGIGGLAGALPAAAWLRSASHPGPAGAAPDRPAAAPPAALEHRGVAIQLTSGHRPVETYGPAIEEVADLGANTVLLATPAYMEHARSQAIFLEARDTPAPADFVELIRLAKRRNLRVIVMPMVLLKHPRGSEWRGRIEPPDWPTWWREYRRLVEHYADIAREGRADVLMVGSELVSTEKNTAEWIKVIEAARRRFPGRLGYSANWDHYKPIKFWDRLDLVGMTSYYTLADKKNPPVEQLVRNWEPIRDDILGWIAQINKPLMLTEVGWCSQEGAASAPWNYYQNQKATPVGHEEQRRLYEAFIRAWDHAPGLTGVIWWEWPPSAGGPADFGYTPRHKPAEAVLRTWLARHAAAERGLPATDGATNGGADAPKP